MVDPRASQQKPSHSHLIVELVLEQHRVEGSRCQAGAAELLRPLIDDRLLVDHLRGAATGRLQLLIDDRTVKVVPVGEGGGGASRER